MASIVHEFVHLVYNEEGFNHCVWLEEGLAQYLSSQKSLLEIDKNRYIKWLKQNVLDKELPSIEFLKKHGSNYGEFCDCKTNKYNQNTTNKNHIIISFNSKKGIFFLIKKPLIAD